MAMGINTNVMSLNAQRQLAQSNNSVAQAMQRLSSGLRINSAKDDAAGLGIVNRMTTQVRGLNQAVRNANDGISLAQTAEGAMQESTNILQRMRELAVQSANDSNSPADRSNLQKEVSQLQQELNRIANTTTFNGTKILDGSFASKLFQVGANANETISVSIGSIKATDMGAYQVASKTNIGTLTAAGAIGANGVAGQTLTVNGKASSNVAVTGGDSAYNIAKNVNAASGTTGVSATARTSVTLAGVSAAGVVTFNLSSTSGTGSTVGSAQAISANVTATDLTNLAADINGKSGSTGIAATLSADKQSITLVSEQGYNINIADMANTSAVVGDTMTVGGTTVTEGTNDSIVASGTVTFNSPTSFSVTSNDATNTVLTATSATALLSSVGAVDISTQSGSNSALSVLDQALSFLGDSRADLGAVQNRLESTISNLSNISENVAAARSRVQDADFAAETAALTRAQILQQAGVAMLAQANAAPQSVLSLLQ
jgi:flagellin